MNDTEKLMFERRSVRSFEDRPIEDEKKRLILECAMQSPSAGCQQLYTIIDVTDNALKKALSESCDDQPFIAEAKLVLVFCADCKKWYDAYIEALCSPRDVGARSAAITPTISMARSLPHPSILMPSGS